MRELLRDVFGHDGYRPGQEEVIAKVMAGRPVLAVFPTGGGKSICFQLPALVLDGLTLVVSPLIALMRDQVDGLVARGVVAARMDSTLGVDEEEMLFDRLDAGEVKLLYVAPERFMNDRFRLRMARWNVAMVAIDEVHCMVEWGHNFRPDYLKLARHIRRMKVPKVLAVTATATPVVAAEVRRFFRIAKQDEVRLPFLRTNLELRVTRCDVGGRKQVLLERLRALDGPVVVYVTRQEAAEEVSTFLCREGISARAYHAGLRSDFRARAQHAFMAGEIRVMVATIAFGMGIDKSDIRGVIHYHLPKSPENLVQEMGRAGRDGLPAVGEVLACPDDLTVLENFIHADVPGRRALGAMLDRVLRMGATFEISHHDLSRACDIRQTVVETVLAHLEMDGVITHIGRRHWAWRVKLLRTREQIFAGRSAVEARRLARVLDEAKEVRGRLQVEMAGASGPGLAAMMMDLAMAGEARVEPWRVKHRYRLRLNVEDLQATVQRVIDRFERREREDLKRLSNVVAYVTQDACLNGWLAGYFGAKRTERCGNCDRCHGKPPEAWRPATVRQVTDAEWEEIHAVVAKREPALKTARSLARFLCGMTSPATRWMRDERFGMLSDVPFREVYPICLAIVGDGH